VYAKAVNDGRSDAALSDEEREALGIALAGPPTGGPLPGGTAPRSA
jgi:hypothetical protein